MHYKRLDAIHFWELEGLFKYLHCLPAKQELAFFPTTTTLPKYQNLFSVSKLDSFLLFRSS